MKTTDSLIAFDIGAGNTTFGRDLRRLNPQIGTVICADPYIEKNFERYKWGDSIGDILESTVCNAGVVLSRLTKVSTQGEVEEVVQKSKRGVFKAVATYENTKLPDESVDIVTLNSPHPLTAPSGSDFDELSRILKRGGIFYFGHSTDIHHAFDEGQMKLIERGGFSRSIQEAVMEKQNLVFPMSPVIRSNVKTKYFRDAGYGASSINFIYHENGGPRLNPNWKAWIKE